MIVTEVFMNDTHGRQPPLIPVRSYRFRFESQHTHFPEGLHRHNGYEVYIHIRGTQTLQIADTVIPLQPLDAFVIAPGQVHGLLEEKQPTGHECLSLILTPELLEELSFRDCRLLHELERIARLTDQRLHLTAELWRNIAPLTAGVKDDLAGLHPTERQITMGCLSTMLGVLCFASEHGSAPYVTTRNTHQMIRYIGMHISQNFRDDCSLKHLAEVFSMSTSHLAHSFASVYGMSLHQYVLRCRVTYARRLLHQGESPSTVSQACGFNDYSSFLRAFTRITGLSPSQWKKENAALPAPIDLP